ncbi:CHAP domain-containing protein [Actinoplanes subtropicus]|uniref:CHAP domain-containing protein n=1 Tax=Actinoplanes subtropicus TaxID=543632 RepID=UPI0004C38FD2|nr:CHAP domain-containing protein [Actinoplanes subtropicus]
MTNSQTGIVTPRTTRRRQLTRVLTVGALAAAAAVSMAVPAQAATVTGYHVAGIGSAGAPVVGDPRATTATPITRLAQGTALTIDCGVRARGVHRDTVWHHITSPVSGYVSDYYTDTPGFSQFLRGEATCTGSSTPATPAAPPAPVPPATGTPVATRGATTDYNEGYAGSCVFYVMDRFHQMTGVYPKAFGDARYLASGAAASGWTVSDRPRVNSIAIFQPGQNGAGGPTGHAAWVEQVSGGQIYIAEMNAPKPYVVTHRWLTPVAGVRFIYVP